MVLITSGPKMDFTRYPLAPACKMLKIVWMSVCTVRISTEVLRTCRLNPLGGFDPFMTGMLMSIITTSGLRVSVSWTASEPSPASPTT